MRGARHVARTDIYLLVHTTLHRQVICSAAMRDLELKYHISCYYIIRLSCESITFYCVLDNVVILGCDSVWSCRLIPTFRRNMLSPFSELKSQKMETVCFSEMLVTSYEATRCHNPDEHIDIFTAKWTFTCIAPPNLRRSGSTLASCLWPRYRLLMGIILNADCSDKYIAGSKSFYRANRPQLSGTR
jgi:hypothetical protein